MGKLVNIKGKIKLRKNDGLLILWPRLYFINNLIIIKKLS